MKKILTQAELEAIIDQSVKEVAQAKLAKAYAVIAEWHDHPNKEGRVFAMEGAVKDILKWSKYA